MALKRARDREMLDQFEAGQTISQLADEHRITISRVFDVLRSERHRRNVSPEPYYRDGRLLSGHRG